MHRARKLRGIEMQQRRQSFEIRSHVDHAIETPHFAFERLRHLKKFIRPRTFQVQRVDHRIASNFDHGVIHALKLPHFAPEQNHRRALPRKFHCSRATESAIRASDQKNLVLQHASYAA